MSTPYNLQLNSEYAYEFVTDQGNKYLVYFTDASDIFNDYPSVNAHIYSFNIDVKSGNADTSKGDERISFTILEVFRIFFSNFNNIAVYFCDISDNRQLSRHRKFSLWFWRFNDGSIIKEDAIVNAGGAYLYNSILIHKDNPLLPDILAAFKHLTREEDDK